MVLSQKYEDDIVFEIKQCYMDIYLDDQVSDVSNWFVRSITKAVQDGNSALHNIFNQNPHVSFRTNTDDRIFRSFADTISNLLYEVTGWVNTFQRAFGSSADLASAMLPYVLDKIGIAYSEAGVFVPLALLINKTAVDISSTEMISMLCQKKKSDFQEFLRKNLDILSQVTSDSQEVQGALKESQKANEMLLSLL